MKKISLLLVVIMLFSMFSIGVYAEDLPTIYADATKTENNTVELLLSISENSNIAGCSFNIVYDSNKLTYTSHEVGNVISSMMNLVNPNYNDNAIRVLWADTNELVVGGNIIKIVFAINEGASGSTDITIDKLKMMDVSSLSVDCSCENPITVVLDSALENEDLNIEETPADDENNTNSSENIPSEDSNSSGNHSSNSSSSGTVRPTNKETQIETTNNNTETSNDEESDKKNKYNGEEDYEVFLLNFNDVKESDWFYANVQYVVGNKLMNGVAEDKFAPNDTLTRAMLVTVLYRNTGEPAVNKSIPFTDVNMGSWYANAVIWAKQNGIVNGVNETDFAPDANITREQIATIMFRYAQYKGMDAVTLEENLHFTDSSEISEYAVSAMNWAVGTGLMKGKSATTINPKDNATRAEIAAILQRFIGANK